jgi:hypothetical protein
MLLQVEHPAHPGQQLRLCAPLHADFERALGALGLPSPSEGAAAALEAMGAAEARQGAAGGGGAERTRQAAGQLAAPRGVGQGGKRQGERRAVEPAARSWRELLQLLV